MEIPEIVLKIKQKKELSGIANSLVEEQLRNFLRKYSSKTKNFSDKETTLIVKEVRSELRKLVGRFQVSSKKESFSSDEDILDSHASTRERIGTYSKIKSLLSNLKVKSILDLGCGLNPLALAKKPVFYYASDINESNLKIIEDFFKREKILGKTFIYDLRKIDSSLPEADICLIFKVLDLLAQTQKLKSSLTEKIFHNVKCKHFLISFSTRKLSGARMRFPRRIWFEKTLSRLNLSYETFSNDNEIFYLIKSPEN